LNNNSNKDLKESPTTTTSKQAKESPPAFLKATNTPLAKERATPKTKTKKTTKQNQNRI
jgi:hypothetical protein